MGWIDRLIETEDRMVADAEVRERARCQVAFEHALRDTWAMVDPLNPPGQAGSYARGEHNGICAALQTMRENYERRMRPSGVQPSPALSSIPALVPAGQVVAWMWQHEESGAVGFIDQWQIDNGWEAANPRLRLIRPLVFADGVPGQNGGSTNG